MGFFAESFDWNSQGNTSNKAIFFSKVAGQDQRHHQYPLQVFL